jgi:hypothetical protein
MPYLLGAQSAAVTDLQKWRDGKAGDECAKSPEPEVTSGRLSDRGNEAFEKVFALPSTP